jgi:hypothetical protein
MSTDPKVLALVVTMRCLLEALDAGRSPADEVFNAENALQPFSDMGQAVIASPQPGVDPTVIASGVFHMLVSIMGSDNGVLFHYDSEDRRRAVPAIVEMIAAGYFTGDPEALDGDFWQMAAGEETEKVEYFSRAPEAFAAVEAVLNDIFDRPPGTTVQPSVPAAEVLALVDRLEDTPNWYRQSWGEWKNAVHSCDSAPKDAASMLRKLITAHALGTKKNRSGG